MTRTDILNATLAALTVTIVTVAASFAGAEPATPAPKAELLQTAGATCGKRNKVVGRLASKFGETRRGIGLGTKNRVIEIFASEASGSWTVTVTLPDGRTCLLASGQNWEDRMDDLSHLVDADA